MVEVAEKCGVAGVYLFDRNKSASSILYNLLLALYHRGHEGAGIASFDQLNGLKRPYKGLGRIRDIFKEGKVAEELGGHVAIGHTRYGTVGSWHKPEVYLHPIESPNREFCIAQNGTISPYEFNQLLKEFSVKSNSDTEALAALLEKSLFDSKDWVGALATAAEKLDGSYTCTILTKDGKLIGIREPRGFKPLNYGEIDNGYAIASETSALKAINAKNIKPVQPGEMIIIDETGLRKERFAKAEPSPCSFEAVYFSDVTSEFDGLSCFNFRVALGRKLAKKYPVEADFVGAVPEAGRPGALGYSWESGIPYTELFRVNREVGRVFILPEEERPIALRRKYLPIVDAIRGSRLVVVDDSIVRGDTTGALIRILREAGAKEVHVRILFHPIKYPCIHGGVAFASRNKLAMNKHNGIEGVREYIGADSLGFCSPEDMEECGMKNACFACGTGNYPLKHPELKLAESLGYIT